jgi:hypothetical protein
MKFSGRLAVVVHNGRVSKSSYEKDISAAPMTWAEASPATTAIITK